MFKLRSFRKEYLWIGLIVGVVSAVGGAVIKRVYDHVLPSLGTFVRYLLVSWAVSVPTLVIVLRSTNSGPPDRMRR